MNREEFFNLHHASARNVIERIFGVLKRRFHILLLPTEYSMDTQVKILAVLCAIHNFIRFHTDSTDDDEATSDEDSCKGDNNIPHEGMGIPGADVTDDIHKWHSKAMAGRYCSSDVE